jgi:hypothetical protein
MCLCLRETLSTFRRASSNNPLSNNNLLIHIATFHPQSVIMFFFELDADSTLERDSGAPLSKNFATRGFVEEGGPGMFGLHRNHCP